MSEHHARGVELHLRRITIPERPTGEANRDAHARGLVRRLDFQPDGPCVAQHAQRGARIAFREEDRASGLRGHGVQQRRVEVVGGRAQLLGGGARRRDVANRQHDVGVRGQQPASRGAGAGVADGEANGRRRGIGLPLRQPEQREPGLRRASVQARASVRLFGFRDLSAQPVQLAALIERGARRRMTGAQEQSLAGFCRGGARVRPGPLQLQDLGATDQALSAVWHQIRLRLAPARQNRRPLPRAPKVEDLQTALDHAAVDVARRQRRHVARIDRDDRFVEQTDAFLGLPRTNQNPAETVPGERDQIAIAEALADRRGLGEEPVSAVEIAFEDRIHRDGQPQIAGFDALASALVQQALRAGDPGERAGELMVLLKSRGEPERTPDRPLDLTATKGFLVGARPDLRALRLPAGEIERRREPLQILGLEWPFAIGGCEMETGLGPRASRERISARRERVGCGHAVTSGLMQLSSLRQDGGRTHGSRRWRPPTGTDGGGMSRPAGGLDLAHCPAPRGARRFRCAIP